MDYDNDELIFLDDDGSVEEQTLLGKDWNILIVDDDEEIHTVTRLALSDLIVNDRKLNFIHAYSAKQAKLSIDQAWTEVNKNSNK